MIKIRLRITQNRLKYFKTKKWFTKYREIKFPDVRVTTLIKIKNDIFCSIDIFSHRHLRNIKTLSQRTNILGVPGENIKRNS